MIHLDREHPRRCVAQSRAGVDEATFRRARVPCKRCLASLAKADRAFRAKSREGLRRPLQRPRHETYFDRFHRARCHQMPVPPEADTVTCGACLAARAIAAEEGRAACPHCNGVRAKAPCPLCWGRS